MKRLFTAEAEMNLGGDAPHHLHRCKDLQQFSEVRPADRKLARDLVKLSGLQCGHALPPLFQRYKERVIYEREDERKYASFELLFIEEVLDMCNKYPSATLILRGC